MEPSAFDSLLDRFHAYQHARIVPIFSQQYGKHQVVGTGSIWRIADVAFLLTAYHVLELHLRHDFPLWLGQGQDLEGGFRLTSGEVVSFDDQTDIALIRLSDKLSNDLLSSGQIMPIRSPQIWNERPDAAMKGTYALCGFPSESVEHGPDRSLRLSSLLLATNLLEGDRSGLESDFKPDLHYLFQFREGMALNKETGERVPVPPTGGMSGSLVWRLFREDTPLAPSVWRPEEAVVVGVFTGVYDGRLRALKATSTAALVPLVRSSFPDLRTALDLVWPNFSRT